MTPAAWPRAAERVLWVAGERIRHRRRTDLPAILLPGDLVVVNDAATLPASLAGDGVELRLTAAEPDGSFQAVVFGAGDWRTRTEDRPPPPSLASGSVLTFGALTATVVAVSPLSPRLVTVRFAEEGAALWQALYRVGRPIQYAHVAAPLALWHVQTGWGTRPWAFEPPSAGLTLSFSIVLALRQRGVALATLTHAAGLSATGDPVLDAALPLDERYELPAATIAAIERAERVIAVGTTVVRALEGCAAAHDGRLVAGPGRTDLVLDERHERRIVDGLLTGQHEPGTSHYRLLGAFARAHVLARAADAAERAGYLSHEFGDALLLLSE